MKDTTHRRTILTLFATAAATGPAVLSRPTAAHAADRYSSNTALYADPALTEGIDYDRRFRRHGVDDDRTGTAPLPRPVVIAPHGGGIEPGTSELCLAVAGYHPATVAGAPAAGPTYDYWMFEGLRSSGNDGLHVTSTRCDDPVARALCAGTRRAVALHGCTPAAAGLLHGTAAVLVGGRDAALKDQLLAAYAAAGIPAIDAAQGRLDGDDPANIVNRTVTGAGAQLELTTPLREAMFKVNTRTQRKHTTRHPFQSFVDATRAAIAAA